MDYENIKELIALIDASSLKEMEYSKDGIFLRLSKNENKIVETHGKNIFPGFVFQSCPFRTFS